MTCYTLLFIQWTRGGHCHRRCSHSCDWGQNILTIVFVAWLLDHIANGALTIWPHTLNTNCLPFLILMAIKMQPSRLHYRVWKLSLTAWPTPKTALDPLTASWPRSQLWLRHLWEWPPLDEVRRKWCNVVIQGYKKLGGSLASSMFVSHNLMLSTVLLVLG